MNYGGLSSLYNLGVSGKSLTNMTAPATATTAGPLDNFISNPTAYAPVSTSTSYSGLSPEVTAALTNYLNQSTQNISGYNKILSDLSNPNSFNAAYKPVYEGLLQKAINSLNSKGMVNSTVAKGALSDVGNQVTSQYLQQLMSIASLFNNAASLPVSIADLLKTSTSSSTSTNPASAYEILANILTNVS